MDVSQNSGKTTKMDGENNGKPYFLMDDLGVPLFWGWHPNVSRLHCWLPLRVFMQPLGPVFHEGGPDVVLLQPALLVQPHDFPTKHGLFFYHLLLQVILRLNGSKYLIAPWRWYNSKVRRGFNCDFCSCKELHRWNVSCISEGSTLSMLKRADSDWWKVMMGKYTNKKDEHTCLGYEGYKYTQVARFLM